jgi:hypothetical protein
MARRSATWNARRTQPKTQEDEHNHNDGQKEATMNTRRRPRK